MKTYTEFLNENINEESESVDETLNEKYIKGPGKEITKNTGQYKRPKFDSKIMKAVLRINPRAKGYEQYGTDIGVEDPKGRGVMWFDIAKIKKDSWLGITTNSPADATFFKKDGTVFEDVDETLNEKFKPNEKRHPGLQFRDALKYKGIKIGTDVSNPHASIELDVDGITFVIPYKDKSVRRV